MPTRIPNCEVKKATPKAILVDVDGDETWVPKSAVHDDSEVWDDSDDGQGPGELVLHDWFEKDGLT